MVETKRDESEMISVEKRDVTRSLPKGRSLVTPQEGWNKGASANVPHVRLEIRLLYLFYRLSDVLSVGMCCFIKV